MSGSRERLGLIAITFVVLLCAVLLHLWFVMIEQHDLWLLRSHENRWSFREVPSVRGALRDREGRLLAYDQPTIDLAIHYGRFRRYHPVGAAVHGATVWVRQQPSRAGTTFGYREGPMGPTAACQELLAMPMAVLRKGVLQEQITEELKTCVLSVWSAATGRPRRSLYPVLRTAIGTPGATAGNAVPGFGDVELLLGFAESMRQLAAFDADIIAVLEQRRADVGGDPSVPVAGLLDRLDRRRRDSLDGVRAKRQRTPAAGSEQAVDAMPDKPGELLDNLTLPLVPGLPFELAASLRTSSERHPGLVLQPALLRVRAPLASGVLGNLLGEVRDLDVIPPSIAWLDARRDTVLDEEALAELVPAAAVPNQGDRELLQQRASANYRHVLLRYERRGVSGIEAALDPVLSGDPGLRLVERDATAREQLLWSHLRVQPGQDVTLTLDADLMRVVDEVAATTWRRYAALAQQNDDQPGRVEVALSLIDAGSGDVLALGGAPQRIDDVPYTPGLSWRGPGDLGSVVKPFLLLEHEQAILAGRPHRSPDAIEPCKRGFPYGGRTLMCSAAHWGDGQDPVQALSKSCNGYFFQLADGLGEAGVSRALRRFGLQPPDCDEDPMALCYQPRLAELRCSAPRVVGRHELPMRGVGYGVEATPLAVARAYAGLATGRLPTLGLRAGERRPTVRLDVDAAALELVREGLRQCVLTGTARGQRSLRDFQVLGKTGTAEIGKQGQNNAWFAGFVPWSGRGGVQLCFAAVVYWVPDRVHGGDAAGELVGNVLQAIASDAELHERYLRPESGR